MNAYDARMKEFKANLTLAFDKMYRIRSCKPEVARPLLENASRTESTKEKMAVQESRKEQKAVQESTPELQAGGSQTAQESTKVCLVDRDGVAYRFLPLPRFENRKDGSSSSWSDREPSPVQNTGMPPPLPPPAEPVSEEEVVPASSQRKKRRVFGCKQS